MSPTGLPDKTAAGLSIPESHYDSVTVVVVSGTPTRFRAQCTYPGCPAPYGRVRDRAGEAREDVIKHRAWVKTDPAVQPLTKPYGS